MRAVPCGNGGVPTPHEGRQRGDAPQLETDWQNVISPGIEPGTFSVLTKCDNRYTTKPLNYGRWCVLRENLTQHECHPAKFSVQTVIRFRIPDPKMEIYPTFPDFTLLLPGITSILSVWTRPGVAIFHFRFFLLYFRIPSLLESRNPGSYVPVGSRAKKNIRLFDFRCEPYS